MTERRYVLGIAYQAGRAEQIQKGMDGARDYFPPDDLEKAAWEYAAGTRDVGLFHIDGTEGHVKIVESYIYRGPDWPIGDTIVKSGDWLIGGICDEAAWAMVKADKVTGWSPQGRGRRRAVA